MRKRILFLLHDNRVHGGANSSLFDTIDGLTNVDIFIGIRKHDDEIVDYIEKKGYRAVVIPYPLWTYRVYNPWYKKIIRMPQQLINQIRVIPALAVLKKYICEYGITTIYTNTFCSYIGCMANKKWGIRHIWHIREYGIEDHGFGIILGQKTFVRFMNRYADELIFISKSLASKYEAVIEDKKKIHMVYDDLSTRYINEPNERTGTTNILMAGLIQAGKGQLEVIKAFELARNDNKNIKLFIAGETGSPYYYELLKYIKKRHLDEDIEFLGFVKDMNQLRSNMDIGIVASRSEAFGRVTVEGMLSHMVMIGANAAGTSELIKDGVSGLLYEPGNIQELAECIVQVSTDKNLSREISDRAFEYAKNQFTTGKCSRRVQEILELN